MNISKIIVPNTTMQTSKNISAGEAINERPKLIAGLTSDSYDSTESSIGSLTQNVLYAMANFGLDTTLNSDSKSDVLQNFVVKLYDSLTSKNTPSNFSNGFDTATLNLNSNKETDLSVEPITIKNADIGFVSTNINEAPSINNLSNAVDSSLISGGKNFKYSIDLSQSNLGNYTLSVIDNLKKALENIGQYINSDITFNLKVISQNEKPNILAQTNTSMIEANPQSQHSIDTSFVSDTAYKYEFSPNSPDATLFINASRLNDMSFSGIPEPTKFDFTSILTHEILHGIAFTGTIGTANNGLKTKYDQFVSVQGNTPYFVGPNAIKANGGNPVLLVSENAGSGSAFYHVAETSDLMSDTINKGQVKTISALNIAMLEDIGIPIIKDASVSTNSAKIQSAYGNSNNMQPLLSEIKNTSDLSVSFDSLINTFAGSSKSPIVTLQNFLAQINLIAENNNSSYDTAGVLISVMT